MKALRNMPRGGVDDQLLNAWFKSISPKNINQKGCNLQQKLYSYLGCCMLANLGYAKPIILTL